MKHSTVQPLDNPVLVEPLIAIINTKILAELSWLDNAFGKAQRLARDIDGRILLFPAIYVGGDEYESAYPSGLYGNYSWWDFPEPYEVLQVSPQTVRMQTTAGLVFFADLTAVDSVERGRGIETFKDDVMRAVIGANAKFEISSVAERWDDVYLGYNLNEVESQYMMHPYAAIRLNGNLRFELSCT